MPFKYAIALTGGIATGKSSATVLLSLYGFQFIDLDTISHKILNKNSKIVCSMFGNEYKNIDNSIDRIKLGQLLFNNKREKLKLEKFIHPLIYDEVEKQSIIQDKFKTLYIIDIPLFFEKNSYPIRNSIVVYCPLKKQIERLMKRDNINKENAIIKINNQMNIDLKKKKATYIIDNSINLKHLQKECEALKHILINL